MLEKLKSKYKSLSLNTRIILVNICGAVIVKGLSLIVSVFTTPAYIHFFNNEVTLGIWFTILSVVSWILNFDLGIGNGLRNHLTKAYTEKEYKESKCLVTSAYVSVGMLCVIVIVIFLALSFKVDWNIFFNISTDTISSKAMLTSVRVVFVGIILQMFFKIISSVLYAVQKSSINNALTLITALILLVTILIVPSKSNDYNIILMAVIYDFAVLLPYVCATLFVFTNKIYKKIRPSISCFTLHHSKKVLSLGGLFFVVQVLYMLIMSTNEYIITAISGSGDVVEYKIYNQIFTLGSTLFALGLTPIWSAVTKATAEKDYKWIMKLYKKMLILAGIGSVLEFAIIPILQNVINLWLGNVNIDVKYNHAACFALLGGLMIFNSVFSSIANGIGKLKTQLWVFGIGAIMKIPIVVYIFNICNTWIGVVWATNIALLLYCIIQPITIYSYFRSQKMNNITL